MFVEIARFQKRNVSRLTNALIAFNLFNLTLIQTLKNWLKFHGKDLYQTLMSLMEKKVLRISPISGLLKDPFLNKLMTTILRSITRDVEKSSRFKWNAQTIVEF
jgi:hypothetical protein